MVLVIRKYIRLQFTFLLVICGLLVACQPKSTMTNKTSLEEKVEEYLKSTHNIELLDLSVNKQVNTGNLGDDRYPYIADFTSKELGIRSASLKFYKEDELEVEYDTYPEELVCERSDQAIMKEGGDIPFVMYTKMMDGRANRIELNSSNHSLDDLQAKIFEGGEVQILVLVTAPDIKENKRKYEEFHIEIMRRLKAQGVENGSLTFIFLDEEIDLETSRTSPRSVITVDNPIKQHTLQRWVSIHKIKWYDMVKDHPDKVLKYGKIFDK